MIGQTKILEWIYANKENAPHFVVLIGSRGSGKRTLAQEMAKVWGCVYSETDIKVDNVREVIDSAYKSATKVMYCFADADSMRAEAKNAMLKITEEPPVNAYFVMTVRDESSLLDTIKSRSQVFLMEGYNSEQLLAYAVGNYDSARKGHMGIIPKICATPGDIDLLYKHEVEPFYQFVNLVLENIATVEPANAFKSAQKLALKTDEGYDLELFLKCVLAILYRQGTKKAADGICVTSRCLNKLQKVGVNKVQLYDSWVFDIRGEWV